MLRYFLFPWSCQQAPSCNYRTIQLYSHDMYEPKESITVGRHVSLYWFLSWRMCLAKLWFLSMRSLVRLQAGSWRWLQFLLREYSQLNQDALRFMSGPMQRAALYIGRIVGQPFDQFTRHQTCNWQEPYPSVLIFTLHSHENEAVINEFVFSVTAKNILIGRLTF